MIGNCVDSVTTGAMFALVACLGIVIGRLWEQHRR